MKGMKIIRMQEEDYTCGTGPTLIQDRKQVERKGKNILGYKFLLKLNLNVQRDTELSTRKKLISRIHKAKGTEIQEDKDNSTVIETAI